MEASSPRHRALEETRRFKASWVELGAALSEVAGESLWRLWGFESFEKYCRAELHLRAETASKVVRSYTFLHARRDPATPSAAPPLDVVDLLSQAQSRTQLPDAAYQAVEAEVLSGAELSRGQVLRRLRHHDPHAFRQPPRAHTAAGPDEDGAADGSDAGDAISGHLAASQPAADGADATLPGQAAAHIDPQALRKTLALAARLAELLQDLGLGEQPTRHVQAVVRALRGMVSNKTRAGAA